MRSSKTLAEMTYLDDIFMTAALTDNEPAVRLMLRTILGMPDLSVKSFHVQKILKSTHGRSIALDVLAEDSSGKIYNVEIQNDKRGAHPRRARYHAAMIDVRSLPEGKYYDSLPDCYVIFLTRDDVFGMNEPIYHFNRVCSETDEPLCDGSHIVYVNCSHTDSSTELGRLILDLRCPDPDKMAYKELAEKARKLKTDGSWIGVHMDEIFQEGIRKGMAMGRAEAKAEGKAESVHNLARNTNISLNQAMDMLLIPEGERAAIIALIEKM